MSATVIPLRPNAPVPPSSSQTIGPFFPQTFFRAGDNDLTRIATNAAPSTAGGRIILRGVVRRGGGGARVNALLEARPAHARGRLHPPAAPGAAPGAAG